jgi:uncharacterized protein (UPF0332 family)
MADRQKEIALYRMKESEEAFRSGDALLTMYDFRGSINRFYYAAFYATQALLILKGKDARTHSGNLYLFREEYIRTGTFPPETNDILSGLLSDRIESDYAPMDDPTQKDAEAARNNCEKFLRQARKVFDALI